MKCRSPAKGSSRRCATITDPYMLAIRPPEYFPRLSFLAHVAAADRMVLADTFQYSRQSFQNRTRLRTPQGWQWLSVPLLGGQHGRPIDEVEIDNREPWARKHWRSLTYNYSSAPFFVFYGQDIYDLLHQDWKCLGDLTCATVELLSGLFGLNTRVERASNLPAKPANLAEALLQFNKARLIVAEETARHDARLVQTAVLLRFDEPTYRQNFTGFEPGMTALDLLFNYGPDAGSMLRQSMKLAASPADWVMDQL